MKDVSNSSTGCKEKSNFTEADQQKLCKINIRLQTLKGKPEASNLLANGQWVKTG